MHAILDCYGVFGAVCLTKCYYKAGGMCIRYVWWLIASGLLRVIYLIYLLSTSPTQRIAVRSHIGPIAEDAFGFQSKFPLHL